MVRASDRDASDLELAHGVAEVVEDGALGQAQLIS